MARHTVSRRRVLAGASGAVAIAAAGCSGGSRSTSTPPATQQTRATTGATGSPTAAAPTATPTPRAGGVARFQAPRTLSFDTFDAARTGELATLEVLGRTHSRLIEYSDFSATRLRGDLASGWEQPDSTTLILHLDETARWQPREPLNGRAVVAADAAAALDRIIALGLAGGLPAVQRSHDWASFASVRAVDERQLEVRLNARDPFALNTLAGAFALVQAPETVEAFEPTWSNLEAAQVVGTGPFIYEGADAEALALSAYRAGHRRPQVDGLRVTLPLDPVEQFRERLAHEVTTFDRRDSAALRADPGPEASAFQRLSENPVITTMFVGSPPWNDLRLRQAIAAALDPRELITRLTGGNGQTSWPVLTVPEPAYGLSEAQLTSRLGTVDEARTRAAGLWDAAGGASLGTVTIDIPNVFDPRFSASSVVVDLLSAALGPQFHAAVLPYTEISARAAAREYGNGQAAFWLGWSPPMVDPDPARNLIETYSSRGPNFATTGFVSAEVDAALDRLLAEDDTDARLELLPAAHEAISAEAGGGVISWFNQVLHVFRWPFLERAAPSAWWGQHFDAETSVDTADPRYR